MALTGASFLLLAALAACGGSDDDSSADASMDVAATMVASADGANGEMLAEGAPPATGDETAAGQQPADVDFGSIGREVIIELHVSMHSDDIARTVASITARAAAAGGGIASSDIDYGTTAETADDGSVDDSPVDDGHAVLVVKVPPASVNSLLDGLADSGTVVAVNQSATDVTDQLVDLDVRIANARASVENVRGFMEQTTNLGELVSLESELTRRQTELEQLEAQQRGLSDRVALSTLTIEVRPPPAVAADPSATDDEGIADAFRTGWDAFVAAMFTIVYVTALLAPFLALIAGALLVAWVTRRLVNRRGTEPRTADPTEQEPAEAADPVSSSA